MYLPTIYKKNTAIFHCFPFNHGVWCIKPTVFCMSLVTTYRINFNWKNVIIKTSFFNMKVYYKDLQIMSIMFVLLFSNIVLYTSVLQTSTDIFPSKISVSHPSLRCRSFGTCLVVTVNQSAIFKVRSIGWSIMANHGLLYLFYIIKWQCSMGKSTISTGPFSIAMNTGWW